ncbi:MAG: AAA family ATPase, partial [Planctomycetota bacterium]
RRVIALQEAAAPDFDRPLAEGLCRGRSLDLDQPFRALSKGRKSWLVAAVALSSPAAVLLLDEPAEGLDPEARRVLYGAIRDHIERHGSLALVATHIIADIERVADEVLFIDNGRLKFAGQLEELREEVIEVELAAGDIPPTVPGAKVLGEADLGDVQLVWMRCAEPDRALSSPALARATVRRVGLERLYLALCGNHEPFSATGVREDNECV